MVRLAELVPCLVRDQGKEITQIVEIVSPIPLEFLFPDATPARLEPLSDWLRPHFLDAEGNMLLSIHAFAIRSGDTRIIVDTCLGNGKPRPIPEWANLETSFLPFAPPTACEPFGLLTIFAISR